MKESSHIIEFKIHERHPTPAQIEYYKLLYRFCGDHKLLSNPAGFRPRRISDYYRCINGLWTIISKAGLKDDFLKGGNSIEVQ